jgi:hypothetical protein
MHNFLSRISRIFVRFVPLLTPKKQVKLLLCGLASYITQSVDVFTEQLVEHGAGFFLQVQEVVLFAQLLHLSIAC